MYPQHAAGVGGAAPYGGPPPAAYPMQTENAMKEFPPAAADVPVGLPVQPAAPMVVIASPNQVMGPNRMGPVIHQADGSSQGGGFSRPRTTQDRLILDFFPVGCCGQSQGLEDTLPQELAQRGVTQEEWNRWIGDLRQNVQPQHVAGGVCGMFWGWFFSFLIFPVCILCCQISRYNHSLEDWVNRLNRELLEPRGMYAKTQTGILDENYGKYHRHEELSWLAISLNPMDASKLRIEGHLFQFQRGCPCCTCCGCPEHDQLVEMSCCHRTYGCCGDERMV